MKYRLSFFSFCLLFAAACNDPVVGFPRDGGTQVSDAAADVGITLDGTLPDVGSTLDGTVPDGTVPDGTVPDGTVPDGQVPDGTVPDGTVPDGEVTDGTVPDGTVPDGQVPDAEVPDAEVPDAEVPDAEVPDGALPDGEVPDAAVPPVPPEVVSTLPADGALDVPVDTEVEATFDVAMDPLTLTAASFTVTGPAALVVEGVLSYDPIGFVASFAPVDPLLFDTEYTATLTEAVTDLVGTPLAAEYTWTFTTALPPVAPEVVVTLPEDAALGVLVDTAVEATFDVAMESLSLTADSFTVTDPAGLVVEGVLSYDAIGFVATFAPVDPLQFDTEYTAALTEAVTDMPGTPLAAEYTWTFTTAAVPIFLMEPVNLRSLSAFAVAAGAGLTNANTGGFTVINGDVALSPTPTCVSDGSPCGINAPTINGTLYANDPGGIAAQALVDLSAAYVDAMSRPVGTIVNDLSGMVLTPGVYTSASTMSVAVGGTVTLDGQGDANAVFIFQIGSSLTVNNGARVILINGARAQYVYWAAFASSTLGSNVAFQGNVLAGASNSVGTGSTVLGRLLCRTGQITLLANTITRPPL